MTHNVWTCGDYTKNLNGFTVNPDNQNLFITLDNTFAINGDTNILMNRANSQTFYAQKYHTHVLDSSEYGKTFTFSANVKNRLSGNAYIQIACDNLVAATIPKDSEGVFEVTFSNMISDTFRVAIVFPGAITGNLFIDNFVLEIQ